MTSAGASVSDASLGLRERAELTVESGHDEHVERCGGQEPTQDDHGHGRLDLAAGLPAGERERHEAEPRRERRHHDGDQALLRPALHGFVDVTNALLMDQVTDVRDQHDAVARGDAEERDEAHQRCHREHPALQEHASGPADERQRQVDHDEHGVAQ
jgi:hypothetical protein